MERTSAPKSALKMVSEGAGRTQSPVLVEIWPHINCHWSTVTHPARRSSENMKDVSTAKFVGFTCSLRKPTPPSQGISLSCFEICSDPGAWGFFRQADLVAEHLNKGSCRSVGFSKNLLFSIPAAGCASLLNLTYPLLPWL